MKHFAFLAAIAAACVAGSGIALSQSIGDAEAGHRIARENCAECHAVEIRPAASPTKGAPPFRTIANMRGMTDMALHAALRTTHIDGKMPNLNLTTAELENVIAYIDTLKVR